MIKVKVDREAVEKETLSLKGEIIETIMYLKGNKPLLKMIVVFVFIILTGVSCSLSFPVISERLNIGNQGFGLLKSVYNGGGLLILFLMPLIKNCQNKIHRFIILSGVMMEGYGIVLNFPIKLVLLLFIGIFSAVTDILFTTFIQKTADEKILGKLFSLITVIAILSSMLGNILYGFLYDALSVQTVMLFSGAVFVLWGGLLWKITDSKVFDFEIE
jgi:DHA3 family macrolide efflux protein-like MFS transporter